VILKARRQKRNQSGQALVEYVILLSIVVGIVAVFMNKLSGAFDVTTARYGGKVEQQLRTGNAPPSIWDR
jgi:Flp pilus assembly pilin Flp